MEKSTITIAGKEFLMKLSFRNLIEFEKVTGKKVYQIDASLSDSISMFYSTLKGSNLLSFDYSYDEFLDIIDSDPSLIQQYNDHAIRLSKARVDATGKVPESEVQRFKEIIVDSIPAYEHASDEYKKLQN